MTDAAPERSSIRFGTKTIDYRITRSPRRFTVSIAVDPGRGVLVTAPRPATVKRLDDLVHAKASWIVERLRRQSDLPPPPSEREFVSGETFLYLGRQYRLRIDLDEAPRPLRLDDGLLRVPLPRHLGEEHRGPFVRAALVDWYIHRARARLPDRVKTWAARLGLAAPSVRVCEPRKRWGSASAVTGIRVNWRVVQAPPSLVDYVLAHELTHLQHPDHTRAFWSALGRVMPDYDTRKARLRELGRSLVW